MRKERLWLIGKIAVSTSLITYFFQKIDIAQMFNYFITCHFSWLLGAIIISFLAFVVWTYKWQILLKTLKVEIEFKKLFSLNLISIFYSLFVPGGQISGEVIKGVKLINLCKRSSEVLVSIAMDKLTGLLALVILALCGIFVQHSIIKDYKLLIGILAILAGITFFALITLNRQSVFLAEKTGRFIFEIEKLRFLKKYILPLWNLFKAYRKDTASMGKVVGYSFIYQLLGIIICYFAALSVKIQISFIVFMWVASIVFLIQALPISISGIGVREGAFIFLLAQHQVPTSQALALSLIIFGITIIIGLVGGIIEIKEYYIHWKERRILND
ncbi:MAG: lysylphosphatidylglycerol synthase transmembrane domain-containing protein [bacterium]